MFSKQLIIQCDSTHYTTVRVLNITKNIYIVFQDCVHTAYIIICVSIKTKYLKQNEIWKHYKRLVFIISTVLSNDPVCLKLNFFLS